MVSTDEQLKLGVMLPLDMFVPTIVRKKNQYRDEEKSKSQRTEHNPPSFLFSCQHTTSILTRTVNC